jgi:signal peptide peptidase SppA
MRLPIWQRAAKTPWAITEDQLANILQIARRENLAPETVAQQLGRDLENTYSVEYRDGVAILSVHGPLFRYANLFTAMSGATSYDRLAKDFHAAIRDESVKAVLLDIDSPGGEANGCGEFAKQIYQARGIKPVNAYVGGAGASGAYWIASAADRVIAHETSMLGSIGVRTALIDDSQAREEAGLREYVIVSNQSPYKDVDPGDESDRARVQRVVDDLAAVFISNVAAFRGVSEDKVLNDFGQGDVLVGANAVDAGLADRLGDFEGTLEQLAGPGPANFFASVTAPWSGPATRESSDMSESNFAQALSGAVGAATSKDRPREQVIRGLAAATGIDQKTVEALLAGEQMPTAEQVRAISAGANDQDLLAKLVQAARADGVPVDGDDADETDDSESDSGGEDDTTAERERAAAVLDVCIEAGVPDLAPSLIREGISPAGAQARLGDAGAIRDLCTAAGASKEQADKFINNGLSREQVRSVLLEQTADRQSGEITAHVPPGAASGTKAGAMRAWDEIYRDASV